MFELIKRMTNDLETMCLYSDVSSKLFCYFAGRADVVREILIEEYNWSVKQASDHVKRMFDVMDELWDP